jgi:hypothetical protein
MSTVNRSCARAMRLRARGTGSFSSSLAWDVLGAWVLAGLVLAAFAPPARAFFRLVRCTVEVARGTGRRA